MPWDVNPAVTKAVPVPTRRDIVKLQIQSYSVVQDPGSQTQSATITWTEEYLENSTLTVAETKTHSFDATKYLAQFGETPTRATRGQVIDDLMFEMLDLEGQLPRGSWSAS